MNVVESLRMMDYLVNTAVMMNLEISISHLQISSFLMAKIVIYYLYLLFIPPIYLLRQEPASEP